MTQEFIVSFEQTADLKMVGGKGLNLMRLIRAEMPVPPGFVVSTAAYEAFVTFNHLDEQLAAALAVLEQGKPLAEASSRIRAAFEQGQYPTELADEITHAYRELGKRAAHNNVPVAVRSSATAEDLAEASFAGQQDTYLNMCGEPALLDAIRRCFGSLWSERAIDYRARYGLAPLSAQLAVVVQQMVFAEAAGVTFTADPITGDANLMVIDAVYGLGEALVSGRVTPDHIAVEKRTGAVLSYAIAEKTEMIVATASGMSEQPIPRQKRHKPVLNNAHIQALYQLGRNIEAVYGRPQDLEWCLADGSLYVVQARPITTLPEHPITWDSPGPGQWLHGGGSIEMLTEPISPLTKTFLLPIFRDGLVELLAGFGLKNVFPPQAYKVVNGYLYLHMKLRLRPWHLIGVIKNFVAHLNSMSEQEREQRFYRETIATLRQIVIADLTGAHILAHMQALSVAGMRYWIQMMKLVQAIYHQEKAFINFYNRRVRRPGDPEPEILLRGQKIQSWEAECSTYKLAQLARTNDAVRDVLNANLDHTMESLAVIPAGKEFHSALKAHLEQYGHQLSSFDLSLPTPIDDPRSILTAIQAFINGKESPYTRRERMAVEREHAITMALRRLSAHDGKKFTHLLKTAQHAARTREDALFDVGLAWTYMHRCALELGRRLAQTGVIECANDVFWLTVDEIRDVLSTATSLKANAVERQAKQKVWSTVNAPYLLPVGSKPAFWWSWIFPTPELQGHPDAHTLIGMGVSPGKVTAVARVIHSLEDMAQLNPGEILVARATTPAWTPLFARAAGLITDLGGPMAHGSIVAREVGIPAVMGVGTATSKIRNGQVVTILGSEGKVLLA